MLSLVFAQADIVKIIKDGDAIVDNESTAIVCLYAFYYVVLAAFLFWKSDEKKNKWKFAEISLCSFVLNCLVVPDLGFLLLFFLGKIVDKTCFWILIRVVNLLAHIILIEEWTRRKLKKQPEIKESELLQIDIISTIAILPLTIVWILYKIDLIVWEFSLLMGEFLFIQIAIKSSLVKRKKEDEKKEEEQKKEEEHNKHKTEAGKKSL